MSFAVNKRQQPTGGGLNGTVFELVDKERGDRAEIWPALGLNCFGWQASALENNGLLDMLYCDPALFDNGRPTRSGIPILFPFPNRIAEGRFIWEGKQYQLPLTDSAKKNAAHGFVCRRPWRVTDTGADASSAWLTGDFELAQDDPESSEHWPANFLLRVTFQLFTRRLRITAWVKNLDRVSLPFGLGYHPYFLADENSKVEVPAKSYWELEQSIPTGEVKPVDASRDLNQLRPFREVTVDDVLTDLQPGSGAAAEGLQYNGTVQRGDSTVKVFSSPIFREMVVFTPPHREAFCIEPYTCPTNGVNLQQDKDVGWLSLAPDAEWSSVVEVTV